jgi:hypothetical protein
MRNLRFGSVGAAPGGFSGGKDKVLRAIIGKGYQRAFLTAGVVPGGLGILPFGTKTAIRIRIRPHGVRRFTSGTVADRNETRIACERTAGYCIFPQKSASWSPMNGLPGRIRKINHLLP